MQDKTKYIYFAFNKDTTYTKIGTSKNPKKTVDYLKIASPNIELVYYTDKLKERELYTKLKKFRLKDRWFKLTLVEYMDIVPFKELIPKELIAKHENENKETKPITIPQTEGYKFHGIDGIFCDMQGNFFFNHLPAKKVYNNGSTAILCGKVRKGIIKLRKLAYKV